jgi:uncharacterized protein YbjT (DUF2867 family)
MQRPKILVTAAAGKTGGATARQLLALGFPVRAMVRRRDVRAAALADAGAELTVGSLEDLADLEAAMRGVRRAYFCPPLEPGHLRRATLFATAAEAARLEAVVQLSQWVNDPLHPAAHAREKWLGNAMMAASGLDVITVQPGWFADNYFAALGPAAQFGLMALPLGQGLNAPPSNEDIARVIVGCLANPEPHVGKAYRPTGPELLAPDEIAAFLGKALGRKVAYQDAPLPLFLKVAKSLKLSDFVIAQLQAFLRDYQAGAFALGAPTDAVESVGGARPERFEAIAARYVAASPLARRSFGGWLREAGGIMAALATPAPRIDRIEARYGLPTPTHARLAMDSPMWRTSRPSAVAGKAPVAA